MDRVVRERVADLLQQGKYDSELVALDRQSEKLLELDVDFLLVQKRRVDRKAASHGSGILPTERPEKPPGRLCGRFHSSPSLEARKGNHRAAHYLGKIRQGDGRGLAANPQEKRDRRALVGTDSKTASRYLAGVAHRRNPKAIR